MLMARMEASRLEAKAREQDVGRLEIEEIFSDINHITEMAGLNPSPGNRELEEKVFKDNEESLESRASADLTSLSHESHRLEHHQPKCLEEPGESLSDMRSPGTNLGLVEVQDEEEAHQVHLSACERQYTKAEEEAVDVYGEEKEDDKKKLLEEGTTNFGRQLSVDSQEDREGDESKGKDKRPVSDCRVCGDRAIAHMHYGGICCYSCKAFFRRAVQSGKDKVYRCKHSGDCEVSVASRRSCQKCRFLKCIAVGMTASWVLSEEQCTIRFGKNPGKCGRKRRASQTSHSAEHEEDQHREMPQQHQETRYFLSEEDRQQVAHIGGLYEASKEMISFSENNHALWDKIFGKEEKHAYSAGEINSLVSTLIKKNIFFIESNFFFKQLPPGDQHALLAKNMTEMCHLRGALRFDPSKGSFQWYYNQKEQKDAAQKQVKSITEGDISNFYSSSVAAKNIVTNIERIVKTELPPEVILLMMHIVVFSGDGVKLAKPEMASAAQVHYLSLIQRYLHSQLPAEDASRNISNVMALLVDLRETGEKSASAKINSRSLRTQSAGEEPSFVPA